MIKTDLFFKKKLLNLTNLYYLSFSSLFIGIYHKIFFNPNSYLFVTKSDGIKNYFTYSYYIKNNKSIFNFEGINYPFGENIFYTDSTPILSLSIRFFKQIFPSIENYSIGILNWFLLFSYLICFHFLFKLFRLLSIQLTLCFIGATGVTLLCPQIFRLTGHLALSVSFFIPLTIYYLHKVIILKESKLIQLTSWIFIALITHAYLGFITFCISFFMFFFYFISTWIKNKNLNHFNSFLKNILWIFSPLLLFNLIILLTDFHTGRTTNPFGFFNYYANFNSFFQPIEGGVKSILSTFLPEEDSNWEALNYLGIICIVTLPFSFIILKNENEKKIKIYLLSLITLGVLFMFYAMCIPFKYNMYKIVDVFSILKQFRALGRFGWITFFSLNIISIYLLNILVNSLKSKIIKHFFYILILMIYLFEALPYHLTMNIQISSSPNLFINQKNNSLYNQKISNHSFQAIIPFPFYFIGSENHEIQPLNDEIIKNSMIFSYKNGIPLMSNYLSRSSIQEGKKTMQFLGPRKFTKSIKSDLKINKSFIIYLNDTIFRPFEKDIISISRKLNVKNKESLYTLAYDSIFKVNKNQISKEHKTILFEGFENQKSKIKKNGTGSFKGRMNTYEIIKEINEQELTPNSVYNISFWVYNEGENYGQDVTCQQTFVQIIKNGKASWITDIYSAKNSTIIDENWTLVSFDFKTTSEKIKYQIVSYGDPMLSTYYIIDDLTIKKID